jgi:hypothetical protein
MSLAPQLLQHFPSRADIRIVTFMLVIPTGAKA